MPSTIVWLNERLATTLEIVEGVIGKKIVEQAGLCYFRTATVNQRRSCRPGLAWFILWTTGWAEGNSHEAATLSHSIVLFVSDPAGSNGC